MQGNSKKERWRGGGAAWEIEGRREGVKRRGRIEEGNEGGGQRGEVGRGSGGREVFVTTLQ
eukprot:487334-Hanusia_phi.AAC.1